jgi:hypothetical protein
MEIRKTPKPNNTLGARATTFSGLLAIAGSSTTRGSGGLFVLVGVTGFEPVASAV